MRKLILIVLFFAFTLPLQAQVIDSLSVSPSDTAEGIDVDIVVFGSTLLEYIDHEVVINQDEINLSLCYFKSGWTAVDWKDFFVHIPVDPGNYTLNIIVNKSTMVDTCNYADVTDSTNVQISTLGFSIPNAGSNLASLISVYPNPANDFITIKGQNDIQIRSMTLFDLLGAKITQTQNANVRLDMSTVKSGIYILQLETNKGRLIKRIVRE